MEARAWMSTQSSKGSCSCCGCCSCCCCDKYCCAKSICIGIGDESAEKRETVTCAAGRGRRRQSTQHKSQRQVDRFTVIRD